MNWSEKSESVILCEGFYDRSFWSGLLQHIGCSDPGIRPDTTARVTFPDPWKVTIKQGQFGFASKSNRCIRVKPCGGKSSIIKEAKSALDSRIDRRLLRLVINVDADTNADGTESLSKSVNRVAVEELLRRENIPAQSTPEGNFTIDEGATEIYLVRWNISDAPQDTLPNQQTLERLVCAAIFAAYPDRAECVRQWLASRQNPPELSVKEFAWSVMAGWYADSGCDDFYQCFWRDPKLVPELEKRFQECGAWQVAEKLAG